MIGIDPSFNVHIRDPTFIIQHLSFNISNMPVEIKELKIKAIISPQKDEQSSAKEKFSVADFERLKREIKRECMEELKQFINDKKER